MSRAITSLLFSVLVAGGIFARIPSTEQQQSLNSAAADASVLKAVADYRAAAHNVTTASLAQIPTALNEEAKSLAALETIAKSSKTAEDADKILHAAHDLHDIVSGMAVLKLSGKIPATGTTTPASR